MSKTLAALRTAAERLPREPYRVDRPVDERGQYQLQLSPEFPLAIKRIAFAASEPKPPLTWHTYLEIFVLLSRGCRMQMGGTVLDLNPGDVLVMDHRKLHAVAGFPGVEMEAIVIRFLPEIVRSAGSAAADHLMLLPFYCQIEQQPHVARAEHADAAGVHASLASLLECFAEAERSPYGQTGARAHFLVVLHHLARHFQAAERLKELFTRQQPRLGRLQKVFEHIAERHAERISLPDMARKAGLSRAQFYRMFKQAAGMTLVDYLTQVRLTHAARLLQETDYSIAEIASAVGFADQSYFDRRFRRHFGRTPRHYRKRPGAEPASPPAEGRADGSRAAG